MKVSQRMLPTQVIFLSSSIAYRGNPLPDTYYRGISLPDTYYRGNPLQDSYYRGNPLPDTYYRGIPLPDTYYRGNLLPDTYYRGISLPDTYYRGNPLQDSYYRGNLLPDTYYRGNPLPDTYYRGISLPDTYYRGNPLPDTYYRGISLPDTYYRGNPLPDTYYRGNPLPDTNYRGIPLPDTYYRGNPLQDTYYRGNPLPDTYYHGIPLPDTYYRGKTHYRGNPWPDTLINSRRPILSQITNNGAYELCSLSEISANPHSLTEDLKLNEELNLFPDKSLYLPSKHVPQSPKISPSSIPNPNPSVTTTKTIESGYPKYGGYLYSIPGYSAFQPINYQNHALTTNPSSLLPIDHPPEYNPTLWLNVPKEPISLDEKVPESKTGSEPSNTLKATTGCENNFTPVPVSTADPNKCLNQESTMQITSLAQGSGATITMPREPERLSLKTSIPISRLDFKRVNSDSNFQFGKKLHAPYAMVPTSKAENTRIEIQSNVVIKSANNKDVETQSISAETRPVAAPSISTLIDAAEALKNDPLPWENSRDTVSPKQEPKETFNNLNFQTNPPIISNQTNPPVLSQQITTNASTTQDVVTTKSNPTTTPENSNDQKNQILFFPNKNSSNPKMLLTISQSQNNPQVLLQRTNLESKNGQAPSRLSTLAKPNEEITGKNEKASKVVSLKRHHQDDGDENDFENLITENQIYGNKIVVKEKSQGMLQERDQKNKKLLNKILDKSTTSVSDAKSVVIQPNILYVSNVQFPANLMMFKNNKVNQLEQLLINKNSNNEAKVNEIVTLSNSEITSQTMRYSPSQAIGINKQIHVLKPNNNIIQTLSNKQTNKTDLIFQTNQKTIMNPQIVYQVPMIVDAESISANVQKLTTPVIGRDYQKFVNQHNAKKELTKSIYEPTSKLNEKLFIACPYQVDSKLQPKIVITNIRTKIPKLDELSALDLYEKRRRMRRMKYLLNRDNKDHKLETKKNMEKSEDSIITPERMKAEVDKEFRNTKVMFETESSGSEDEYGEKDLGEYEAIIKEYRTPTIEEETNKAHFLSGLRLATRETLKELELQRQERSLISDAVASACIAVGRLDRIYGIEISTAPQEDPIFGSNTEDPLKEEFLIAASQKETGQVLQSKFAFFSQLQLTAVSQQYKEGYELAWKDIQRERRRREGKENGKTIPSRKKEPDKFTLDTKDQLQILTEIKRSVTENNKLIKQRLDNCYEETDADTIPALAEKNFSELDKLSKMADRSVKMLSLDHRKRDLNPGFDSENAPLLLLNKLEQPFHRFLKLNIPNVSKIISLRSHQEPLIENTSQATSMDEPQNCAGGTNEDIDCVVTNLENDNTETDRCSQEDKAPSWSGIEAVITSYKTFDAARRQELSELSRRNAELRASVARWTAETARRGEVARALLAERASLAAEETAVRASLQRLLAAVHTLTQ